MIANIMHLAELQRKLIAAARAHPPGDAVPLLFEKRITALLRTRPTLDYHELWARAMWRAAVACVAFMVLLSTLVLVAPQRSAPGDLSQDFEKTMLAAVDQEGDLLW